MVAKIAKVGGQRGCAHASTLVRPHGFFCNPISWIKPNIAALDNEEARKADAQDILNHLIERTGLLREPAVGFVDYPHRTFQEYLAACAAGALNEAGDLAQRAIDDQWHETIILAAGTKVGGVPFGNALVKELVERGEKEPQHTRIRYTFFALAVACLETGRQITEEQKTDLSVLSRWPGLELLILSGPSNVSDISGIAFLRSLKTLLFMDFKQVHDFSPLANLINLERLDLDNCPGLANLQFLSSLPLLASLDLRGCNGVVDATPLGSLKALKRLIVNKTQIKDFSALIGSGLESLHVDYLQYTKVPAELKSITKYLW